MGNFRIVLRTNYTGKDGKQPLALKYSEKGKIFQTNINVEISPENWDAIKQTVLKPEADLDFKNLLIRNTKLRAESLIVKFEVDKKLLTADEFKKAFVLKEPEGSQCFFTFAEKEIDLKKKSLEKSTHKQYMGELNKLKLFKAKLTIDEVNTYEFFQEYEKYMRGNLSNKTNTVGKTLKKIKVLLQIALKKEIITKLNSVSYKLKYEKVNREFLTRQELDKLEKFMLTEIPDKVRNSLKCFLFSCYSGLRYQDLFNLRYNNIADGFIDIEMEKTNEPLRIPLSTKALTLVDKRKKNTKEKVLIVYSNQKLNDYLKVGLTLAGIKKNMSFHCSRHTFATISLNLNIPLNVVSKLLGHSDLKQTLIYAKLDEQTKVDEMKKWDGI